MSKDYDYSQIDNPYNDNLERSEIGVIGNSEIDSIHGETTEPEIKTGQSLDNLWLENWLKSRSYKPKTHGFYKIGRAHV